MPRPSATALVTPTAETHVVAADGTYRDAAGAAVQLFAGDVVDRATAQRYGLGTSQEVEVWRPILPGVPPYFQGSQIYVAGSAAPVELSRPDLQPAQPNGLVRPRIDLTNAASVRLVATVVSPGATGAELRLEYAVDNATFAAFAAGNAPKVALAALGSPNSGLVAVPAPAKTFVWLRLMTTGGAGGEAHVADIVVTSLPS